MSKPPFTMSKYANELDLQRDARKYYQCKYEELKKEMKCLEEFWRDYSGVKESIQNEMEDDKDNVLARMRGFFAT